MRTHGARAARAARTSTLVFNHYFRRKQRSEIVKNSACTALCPYPMTNTEQTQWGNEVSCTVDKNMTDTMVGAEYLNKRSATMVARFSSRRPSPILLQYVGRRSLECGSSGHRPVRRRPSTEHPRVRWRPILERSTQVDTHTSNFRSSMEGGQEEGHCAHWFSVLCLVGICRPYCASPHPHCAKISGAN